MACRLKTVSRTPLCAQKMSPWQFPIFSFTPLPQNCQVWEFFVARNFHSAGTVQWHLTNHRTVSTPFDFKELIVPWMHTTSSLFFIFTIASLTPTVNAIFGPKMSHLPALGFRPGRCYQPNLLGINYKWPFWKKGCSCLIKKYHRRWR